MQNEKRTGGQASDPPPGYYMGTFGEREDFDFWLDPDGIREAAKNEPKRRQLLGPFQSGTVGFIMAASGVGKSMFALAIGAAIARMEDLGCWEGDGPGVVKIIDAEMTLTDLSQRLDLMDITHAPNLKIDTLTHRLLNDTDGFSLGNQDHQQWLMREADKDGQLNMLIVDNVTFTLDPAEGKGLYDPETINQIKPLLSWARQKGICLMLIDHTNREGHIHGHSNKERLAEWVCKLEHVPDGGDLSFTCSFPKYRIGPNPGKFDVSWSKLGGWVIDKEQTMTETIREMVRDGDMTKQEICKELDITRKTYERAIRAARV
jgi:hypothetical protein